MTVTTAMPVLNAKARARTRKIFFMTIPPLRERMHLEEQRMRVIRDGDIIEHDDLEKLMARADSLDQEMLVVMRQAIAAALVREAA